MMPNLSQQAPAMKYLATPDVCQLTSLSTEKLREWTSRRSLIPADVPSKQQGSPARYSWATVLVLRLAVVMRDRFHVELKANCGLFAALRAEFLGRPFLTLRSQSLALLGDGKWTLVNDGQMPPMDALMIRLDPHLIDISAGFPQPELARAGRQRDLFPLSGLTSTGRKRSAESHGGKAVIENRRRSV
ncbi:hypothetical protein [Rhodoferax sp.]|uniref:hypothetical protein n=1 Tax=Rhodoferax sp. TaxID=50421 RepID=UPI00272A440B|nr:hypothetical protein [Rhodoferax sp.]